MSESRGGGSLLLLGPDIARQKTKIMASGPITSWQMDGETMETVVDFILGVQARILEWAVISFSRGSS